MEYRVLGSLEVVEGRGRRVSLGGARQQGVLASLIPRVGRTIPLQRLVSRLRRQLRASAIESRHGGYALMLDAHQLDLARFERIASEGREALAAGEYKRAERLRREALPRWRGPALSGLPSRTLRRDAKLLEERRSAGAGGPAPDHLGSGRERQLVAELQPLVGEHPIRERLRALPMLAPYCSGRQREALDLYREPVACSPSSSSWSRARSPVSSSGAC
jgi:DNA-binding SARP family transcriptional activator